MRSSIRNKLLGDAVRAAAEALTLEELGATAVPALGRAFDAPIQLCFGVLQGVLPEAFAATPREMYEQFVREGHYLDYPLMNTELRRKLGNDALAQSSVFPHREFRKSRFYNELFRPFEAEYQAMLPLLAEEWWTPGMAGISLTRVRGQKDFSPADIRDLSRVGKAFQSAARRVRRLEEVLRSRDMLECLAALRPVLALDGAGTLLWSSPRVQALLDGTVPANLSEAARRLVALARGADEPAPLSIHVVLEDGSAVEAQLSLARRASGDPFVVAELEGPAALRGALTAAAARHGLTPAEARVLGLVAEGLHNADIARQLGLSPGTVRIQLSSVFRKLRVRSRLQAALLLRRS
jgi:DNA-binding CsgD family transcriptional regulator